VTVDQIERRAIAGVAVRTLFRKNGFEVESVAFGDAGFYADGTADVAKVVYRDATEYMRIVEILTTPGMPFVATKETATRVTIASPLPEG
jgi:hypothetical protein